MCPASHTQRPLLASQLTALLPHWHTLAQPTPQKPASHTTEDVSYSFEFIQRIKSYRCDIWECKDYYLYVYQCIFIVFVLIMFYDISVFVININISYYYSTSQLHIERGRNHNVVCSVKTRWKNLLGENEVTGNRRANRTLLLFLLKRSLQLPTTPRGWDKRASFSKNKPRSV